MVLGSGVVLELKFVNTTMEEQSVGLVLWYREGILPVMEHVLTNGPCPVILVTNA